MNKQTAVVVNPLSLEEMRGIRDTVRETEKRLIELGLPDDTAGRVLLDGINDALYRLQDAIAREEHRA